MTSGTATRRHRDRQEVLTQLRREQAGRDRRRRAARVTIGSLAVLAVVALVTMALLSARPQQSAEVRPAPDFTLSASDGSSVTLSDLRGGPVLLYFNEGAGCDACIVQMAAIEAEPGFAEADITVLPIVMNTAERINAERERLGAASTFLLDDGTVSAEYGTLGTRYARGPTRSRVRPHRRSRPAGVVRGLSLDVDRRRRTP